MEKEYYGKVWENKGNGQKLLSIKSYWDIDVGEEVKVSKIGSKELKEIMVPQEIVEKPVEIINDKKGEKMDMPILEMDLGDSDFLDLTVTPQTDNVLCELVEEEKKPEVETESAQDLLNLELDF